MYCIINIIYGTHITEETYKVLKKLKKDPEDFGFETLYSGGADIQPGYVGVSLSEFDEATDVGISLSSLKITPTNDDKQKAQDLYDKLPEEIKKTLPKLDVYLVFSTS